MSMAAMSMATTPPIAEAPPDAAEREAVRLLRPLARTPSPAPRRADPSDPGALVRVNLSDAAVHDFGARCLDGSPFAYYMRPATNPADASKFVLYLHGGGLSLITQGR